MCTFASSHSSIFENEFGLAKSCFYIDADLKEGISNH